LVVVNSFGGRIPLSKMSAYCASKFALAGFVDSVRPELAKDGIQICHVHPGENSCDRLRMPLNFALGTFWTACGPSAAGDGT
jgi:NAD(P)-dependent dehydrogenase (short-subunit alcohol dehydrogenase family)